MPDLPSQPTRVRDPCVPSTVEDSVILPSAATSHSKRRPSRLQEIMRFADAQAIPTCWSSTDPVPTCSSESWAPLPRSHTRTFLSPPAVTIRAESGDHSTAHKLPEIPSGFANSFTNSPSLPENKFTLESEPT